METLKDVVHYKHMNNNFPQHCELADKWKP